MNTSYFFGYGSLVNERTHAYEDLHHATLKGWRRTWRHTRLRPVAFLTAMPDPHSSIEGIIAHVPNNDWAALDEREFAYDRVSATSSITHAKSAAVDIAVYQVPKDTGLAPDIRHPIWLSYLDVVIQGYLRHFGEAGVSRFFDTTSGWDAPILNDRAAPNYPRTQQLSAAETALVDAHLHSVGAKVIL
ncbi:gamma-glutamylcyclotransferase family protein [Shimia sp. MMG029]|uniref:gamma-glutamylcyclotransferase family protein n=1 Tax=Shimia sp. MMG029 TaxID=3021978 RepID=UPI0022FF334E|nr:gamma-glutamylcyclotransferase family protein [Shimia sp. MMG029]MDA5555387.1 gamma-glutamylcyclotransferase [Shimia sp. MMG029]